MGATQSTIGTGSGEQLGRRRSAYLDNAKAILIALVVFGHLLELGLLGTRAGAVVYLFIYLFHIPAFAFVSGVLSKPDAYTRAGARRLLSLAGVYVFFQCAYLAMQHLRTGEFSYYGTVVYPTWVLWWLVSLISWRLMLPLFARGRSNRAALISIAVAVALAVASGFLIDDGKVFALSGTFVFLPFFLSGFWATRLTWRLPADRRTLALASVAFLAAAVVLVWGHTFIRAEWLYGRATFSQIGGALWEDVFKRLILLASSGALVAAYLRLVPRRQTIFTRLGKTTLSVYAWHGLAIWAVSAAGLSVMVGGSFLRIATATVIMLVVFGVGPIATITLRLTSSRLSGGPQADPASRRVRLLGIAIVSAFTASLVGKAYLTRLLVVDDTRALRAVALEGPLLFALVASVYVLTRHSRRLAVIALSATDIVVSIAMAATAIYAAYFGQVLTPVMVLLAKEAAEVGPNITELLRPAHLLYAADLPVMAVAAILIGRTRSHERSPQARLATARLAVAALCALLIASVPILSAWRLPDDVDSVAVARKRGVLVYQLVGLPALAEVATAEAVVDRAYSDELTMKIAHLRGGDAGPRIAAFKPGAYKGKNLIVVQMEAVQSLLVDLKVDGVEVVPNLNRLVSESWYFPRTYSQISRGNTADAEFVMNTALYPPFNQASSVRWAAKKIPSLPRLLGAQGYRTATMHANKAIFWNRTELYAALGFQRYYQRKDIGWKPQWRWGASDEVTFDFGLSLMKGLRADSKPFYAQIVTLTSHAPFNFPPVEQRPYVPSAAFTGTNVGAYLSSESYTDKAIGKFVGDLKECGLWDESIVVFYGDHFGLKRPQDDAEKALLEGLLGHPYTDIDFLCVPLIIHLPGQTRGRVIDETLGQVDILPTLADPLGIDLSGFPSFGRDAFVSGDELIGMRGLVPSGSMLNGDVLFMPGIGFEDGTAVNVRTGASAIASAADRRDYEAMSELLRLAAAYADGLPVRIGAKRSLGRAIIPHRDTLSLDTPDQ